MKVVGPREAAEGVPGISLVGVTIPGILEMTVFPGSERVEAAKRALGKVEKV